MALQTIIYTNGTKRTRDLLIHIITLCYVLCMVSLVSFPDDFSLSGGRIRLVICLFHFGSGAPECWRIVLF